MAHEHAQHPPESYNKAFAIAVLLNTVFTAVEAIYGIMAHSMSLLADAGHNLGDVLGLLFAWLANWLLTRNSSERYSYGHRKSTILAALSNALLLVATAALIAYESILKLINPLEVDERTIIIVAFIGILINGGTAILFMRGRRSDLNIQGAFLHLAYDALISIGVVITGIFIYFTHRVWLDPLAGLLIVIAILAGTWELLRNSVNLILDAVPHHINFKAVRKYLCNIPGVIALHDLHIWGLSTRESALTVHLIVPDNTLTDADYRRINHDLKHQFNIDHVTIQTEQGEEEEACGQLHICKLD